MYAYFYSFALFKDLNILTVMSFINNNFQRQNKLETNRLVFFAQLQRVYHSRFFTECLQSTQEHIILLIREYIVQEKYGGDDELTDSSLIRNHEADIRTWLNRIIG